MGPDGAPPDTVVDAFLPDDATAVVPQPRYPEEPSSRISYGASFPAPAAATAGNVGSLLGLYPYSSTSFLLNSSASLRCFRFRQKKIPAATRRATATIGTTTATAIVPPLVSPLWLPLWEINEPAPLAVDDDDEEDDVVPGTLIVLAVFVTVSY